MAKDSYIEKRRKQKRDCERRRREKIKANPELYEQAKREEHQRYRKRRDEGKIKPIAELSARSERTKRRLWKEASARYRAKQKNAELQVTFLENNTPPSSPSSVTEPRRYEVDSDHPSISRNSDTTPGLSRKQCGRKRILRNRSKTKRELEKTQKKLGCIKKKYLKYKMRIEKQQKTNSPRSNIEREIIGENVSSKVKKKLIFAEALKAQLETNFKEKLSHKEKREFVKCVSGKIVKKYRCLNQMSSMGSYKLFSKNKINSNKRLKIAKDIKKSIVNFYQRDEVSRMAPGKKDYITFQKIKKQKRFLNDSMKNLFKKFSLEEKRFKVSYSNFCRYRPFWVLIPTISSRETCLCTVHENIRLLVLKMKMLGILSQSNPEDLTKSLSCEPQTENCLQRLCQHCQTKTLTYNDYVPEDTTSYKKWIITRETHNIKGKDKIIQKNVKKDVPCTKSDLVRELENGLPIYMTHTAKVRHQFKAIDFLKSHLGERDILIHMDFSENYSCKYFREIQSAHFGGSKPQISLHTVVWYSRSNGVLQSHAFCSISDNLRHDPPGILAHLIPLFTIIKNSYNDQLNNIHFVSDGPNTQYKNKKMFYIFATEFFKLLGAPLMTWNFSESGHGKGAPDGIGGCIKRTADQLVANGADIPDLKTLLSMLEENCPNITFRVVTESDFDEADDIIPLVIRSFKGIMKTRQLIWVLDFSNTLELRTMSCLTCQPPSSCVHYYLGKMHFGSAPTSKTRLRYSDVYSDDSFSDNGESSQTPDNNYLSTLPLESGKFVLVEYPERSSVFYVGQIESMQENKEAKVNFMKRTYTSKKENYVFIWPELKDEDIIHLKDIKKQLSVPKSLRRNRFKFSDESFQGYSNVK